MFCLDTNDWLNPQVIQSQYFYFKSSVAALIDSEKKRGNNDSKKCKTLPVLSVYSML